MSIPKFYGFRCPGGRGYPEIGHMTTLRPAGEAGESEKAKQKYFDEITRKLQRGEELVLESIPLEVPLVDIEEKGSKWPDVIGHGTKEHHFIFSERAIEAMTQEGITGFSAKPVQIEKIRSKKLREIEPPPYFCIEVTGGIDIVKNTTAKPMTAMNTSARCTMERTTLSGSRACNSKPALFHSRRPGTAATGFSCATTATSVTMAAAAN